MTANPLRHLPTIRIPKDKFGKLKVTGVALQYYLLTCVNMSFSFWMVSSNCCFIDSKEDFSEESNVTSVVEQLSMLLFLILEEIASILSSLLVWSAIDSNFSTRSVKSEHDKDVLCLLVETDSIL